MHPRNLSWLCALMAAVAMTPATAAFKTCLPDYGKVESIRPNEVVAGFLEAVDRGELRLFGKVLKRNMVTPRRVEFIYELNGAAPAIKVYSQLTPPVPVPDQQNCEARAVGALMSLDGHIIDMETHIWMRPEECAE